ncbi:MAG TPA: hypothetical protein PK079_15070 [Leptospiraceae bacterium]|nr:hypothetical protein [Leptospiraceae bacterium]HMW06758.1 hypothetical protein [Leptospiraceae bacterium]HMX33309.1 hypothetical protein [Leptospiraceae bacterium]HMY32064.1 hypothetical protein [Leptospiraceae bacterium]HMZ63987.1 hypothetical protein [Leptospiraceae bacterium]
MVQVDVFWAYGIGSTMAAAASKKLEEEKEPLSTSFYAKALVVLSCIWAPTGMLLLLKHPSWETMQVAETLYSIPVWLIIGFGITNVTQGILGFWVTSELIKRKKYYLSHLNWIFGYFGMFFILLYGWDGLGYDRFLYDRDLFGGEAWKPGAGYKGIGSVAAMFTSTVAMTLYIDGVFLVPAILYYFSKWTKESVSTFSKKIVSSGALAANYLVGVFLVGFGSAAISAITVYYTGLLIGAGDPFSRYAGTGGSTNMHILSYFLGLPISFAILYYGLFKEGRPFHKLIKKMYHIEN